MATNRRGFLQGVFGGVTAGGLILRATPEDVAAFTAPLARDAPLVLDQPSWRAGLIGRGEHLYNAQGELVAIITDLHITVEKVDVTMAFDSTTHYVQGRKTIDIRAVGLGTVEVESDGSGFHLRGNAPHV